MNRYANPYYVGWNTGYGLLPPNAPVLTREADEYMAGFNDGLHARLEDDDAAATRKRA